VREPDEQEAMLREIERLGKKIGSPSDPDPEAVQRLADLVSRLLLAGTDPSSLRGARIVDLHTIVVERAPGYDEVARSLADAVAKGDWVRARSELLGQGLPDDLAKKILAAFLHQ
jgi:hypothetical protein